MKFFKIITILTFFLSILLPNSIGVFSGLNQFSYSNKKNRHQSLLQSIVYLNYFNLQYSIDEKNSLNIELSSDNNSKNIISIQNRYNFIKNEKIYSGLSLSFNEKYDSELSAIFGSSVGLGNSLLVGVITTIPFSLPNSPLINLYIGAKL